MRLGRRVLENLGSGGLYDFAGLNAAGADAHALADAINDGFDRLQVHVPATASRVVGVGDVVAELRAFAAEITFSCHDYCSNLESQRLPGIKPDRMKFQTRPDAVDTRRLRLLTLPCQGYSAESLSYHDGPGG